MKITVFKVVVSLIAGIFALLAFIVFMGAGFIDKSKMWFEIGMSVIFAFISSFLFYFVFRKRK